MQCSYTFIPLRTHIISCCSHKFENFDAFSSGTITLRLNTNQIRERITLEINPRARAPRARRARQHAGENFTKKIRNPARARRAGAMR